MLYGGPRYLFPFNIKRTPLLNEKFDGNSSIQRIASKIQTNATELTTSTFGGWTWDGGIEFNGNSGLIIGTNKAGIVLGYDFMKL